MRYIVFIAPNWNYTDGGINSFNFGLALAVGDACRNKAYKVACISLLEPTVGTYNVATKHAVAVHTLSNVDIHFQYDRDLPKIKTIIETWDDAELIYLIGHDTLTGRLATYLSSTIGETAVPIVFHHMNYEAYYGIKGKLPKEVSDKINDQREVLANADNIIAVGPKLSGSAESKVPSLKRVYEIIPGIEDIKPKKAPDHLAAIAFGRYSPADDRVKQIGLAACAFTRFVDTDYPAGVDQRLDIIGTIAGKGAEELIEKANQNVNRFSNIITQDYISDRPQLYDKIASAGVALMLSYHEGFGLVGLEAIAAGVPLILTVNSGLYKFLERELAGEKLSDWGVIPVAIDVAVDGTPTEDALMTVTTAYATFWEHRNSLKSGVLKLRDRLRSAYTWTHSAGQLITILLDITSNQAKVQDKNAFLEKYEVVITKKASSDQPVLQQPHGRSTKPLNFRSRYLPLIGREKEWEGLQNFCEEQKRLAWFTLTGSAGVGKSRLALELSISLTDNDWYAGFLSTEEMTNFSWSRWRPVWNTLIIIDHVTPQTPALVSMLGHMQSAASVWQRKVRVLILERDRAAAWSDRLQQAADEGDIPMPHLPEGLSLSGLNNRELLLLIDAMGVTDRRLMLDRIKKIDPKGTPLFMILALINFSGNESDKDSLTLLDKYMVKESADAFKANLKSVLSQQQHKSLVILLTIIGGLSSKDLSRQLGEGRSFLPQEINEEVLSRLGLIDKEQKRINGIEPDILGEYFVLAELSNGSDFAPSIKPIAADLMALAWELSAEQTKAFILRAAQDMPAKDIHLLMPEPQADSTIDYTLQWLAFIPQVIHALCENSYGLENAKNLYGRLKKLELTAHVPPLNIAKAQAMIELTEGRLKQREWIHSPEVLDELYELVENANDAAVSRQAAYSGFRLAKYFAKHWKFDDQRTALNFLDRLQPLDSSNIAGHLLRKQLLEVKTSEYREKLVEQIPGALAADPVQILANGQSNKIDHAITLHTAVFTELLTGNVSGAKDAYERLKAFKVLANDSLVTEHYGKAFSNFISFGNGHWKQIDDILDDYYYHVLNGAANDKVDYLHFWANAINDYSLNCPDQTSRRLEQIQNVVASETRNSNIEAADGDIWKARLKGYLLQMDESNALMIYNDITARFSLRRSVNVDLRWKTAYQLSKHFEFVGDQADAEKYFKEAEGIVKKYGRRLSFDLYKAAYEFV